MIKICYRDQYLVAVNKPAGWLVHRSWLDRKEKVVVMQTVRDMLGQHVFTVHRLDRPTSCCWRSPPRLPTDWRSNSRTIR